MALTINPSSKLFILDSAATTAQAIYSAWVDWVALSDNCKYLPAFSSVGGDDLGGGLFVPPYYFLINGWRIRPMEQNHLLVLSGNLFVDGGGQPVVQTVGAYNVSVQYTVPVQAQAFSTSGSTGPTPSEIAAAVWLQGQEVVDSLSFLHKSLVNKREIKKVGANWVLTIYDNDGVTPILYKQLKDITGQQIVDLTGGLIAVEEASSV